MGGFVEVVARERSAASAHRASLHAASVPPPSAASRDSFLHGFLLPFSLMRATLRDRELRGPYVKVAAVRVLVVVALAAMGCGGSLTPKGKARDHHGPTVVLHHDLGNAKASGSSGVHVHAPGVDIDLDPRPGAKSEVKVVGQEVPVVDVDAAPENATIFASGWARLVAFLAAVSALSSVVIALSRRYDDWIGFGAARLAHVKPEDATRKEPKVFVDVKWIKKKIRERVREAIAFAAGMPVVALLMLVPLAGPILFKVATVAWGWYWLGVTTATKNDHALVDAGEAPPPTMIRAMRRVGDAHGLLAPIRLYARLWAWATKSFDSPAAFFERSPRAFLGLALARAFFALPGLTFLGKSIVPVAAGRLCAEADPQQRFFSVAAEEPTAIALAA